MSFSLCWKLLQNTVLRLQLIATDVVYFKAAFQTVMEYSMRDLSLRLQDTHFTSLRIHSGNINRDSRLNISYGVYGLKNLLNG